MTRATALALTLLLTVAASSAGPAIVAASAPADDGAVASVRIRAVQGTPGGPAVGAAPAILELFGPDGPPRKLQLQLDSDGQVKVDGIGLPEPLTTRVTVLYRGAPYQATGPTLRADQPDAEIILTVYETTDQQPAWEVLDWHVVLEPTDHALRVTETLWAGNPADRAYFALIPAAGKRGSVVLTPSPGAMQITPGGAGRASYAEVLDNGQVVCLVPLAPGKSNYFSVSYLVPVVAGSATMVLTAPAAARQVQIFVPPSLPPVRGKGLRPAGLGRIYGRDRRRYMATNLRAGQTLALAITTTARHDTPLAAAPAARPSGTPRRRSGELVALGVVGAVVVVVLVAAVVVALKLRRPAGREEP